MSGYVLAAITLVSALAPGCASGKADPTPEELRQACEKGQAGPCEELALMYETGTQVGADLGKAKVFREKLEALRSNEAESERGKLRQACDKGEAGPCEDLMLIYEMGSQVKADPVKAGVFRGKLAALYSKGCDGGNAELCAKLGELFEHAPSADPGAGWMKGDEEARDKTRQAYQKGCELKHAQSCRKLAGIHEFGDARISLRIYAETCSLKDQLSCLKAAWMYESGRPRPIVKDEAKSAEFYRKACSLGAEQACKALEDELKGPIIAERATRKACEAGQGRACSEIGEMLLKGLGAAADPVKAEEFFLKACNLKFGRGCVNAGNLHEKRNPQRALELFLRGCESGNGSGCRAVSLLYTDGEKDDGIPADKAKADEFYAKAEAFFIASCGKNNAPGCAKLGELYEFGLAGHGQPKKAAQAFGRACDLADPESCNALARMLSNGVDLPEDREEALRRYTKSCRILKDGSGCFGLAQMYIGDLDVPEDKAKVAQFAGESCDLDSASGCELLADATRSGRGVAKDKKKARGLNEKACAMSSQISCTHLKHKNP